MDPPSYGRGANGEIWKFEENISDLVKLCMQVLSDTPLFFLINSYTTGISSQVLENILRLEMNGKAKENDTSKEFASSIANGKFLNGEIGLPMTNSQMILPCGIFAKWEE